MFSVFLTRRKKLQTLSTLRWLPWLCRLLDITDATFSTPNSINVTFLWIILIVSKSTHEWPRVTTNVHEGPRVTTSRPRVATSDHEWLRVTTSENASKYFVDVMLKSSLHHFIHYFTANWPFHETLIPGFDISAISDWMGEGLGVEQGGGMGATNFPPPAPFHLGSPQFSLKYFLKSCTFTENLLVNFYICHFHFLSFFFSPLVTGSLRGGVGREVDRIWDSG